MAEEGREIAAHEALISGFETAIGAAAKQRAKRPSRELAGVKETVVIADLHIPLHREALLAQIVAEHAGKELVIAGDLNDFEAYGKWENFSPRIPSLDQCLGVADAVLTVLVNRFSRVTLMFGNHDLRVPKRLARDSKIGEFYQWTLKNMIAPLEHRHGVQIIMNQVDDLAGGRHEYVHFYYQQGDCLISHAEVHGKPANAGATKANEWFTNWKKPLKLDDWNVLLQAHTHKQSYNRTAADQHLFEIGCLCGIPAYTLQRQSYGPPKAGYFLLVQQDGETDMRRSRLVNLE